MSRQKTQFPSEKHRKIGMHYQDLVGLVDGLPDASLFVSCRSVHHPQVAKQEMRETLTTGKIPL